MRHVHAEKTGDHLLGSNSCASNFCWIWLILKHPYSRLLFTFGFIRVNPRFITCHDVFRPSDTSLFLSDCQIFFKVKCSCNIESMLVPLMPKVVSISRKITRRYCSMSWRTASMVFGTTTDFGRPSRNSPWSELLPRLNSPYHQ